MLQLNTPSVALMHMQEARDGRSLVQLRLANYNVNGSSVSCGTGGKTFAFVIGPLSDALVAALEGAAQNHERICLLLPEPLLLDLAAIERMEAQRVRIVGHIVDPFSQMESS